MKTRPLIIISFAAASLAFFAPANAQARHGPEYPPPPAAATTPAQTTLSGDQWDRLGAKYVSAPVASRTVRVVSPPGVNAVTSDVFDWTDALIGAAVAAVALVTVAAAALFATRHHGHHAAHA